MLSADATSRSQEARGASFRRIDSPDGESSIYELTNNGAADPQEMLDAFVEITVKGADLGLLAFNAKLLGYRHRFKERRFMPEHRFSIRRRVRGSA